MTNLYKPVSECNYSDMGSDIIKKITVWNLYLIYKMATEWQNTIETESDY